MACNEGSTPINVTTTQNKCNLNCLYQYDYGISSLNVTNNGDHLKFSYDGGGSDTTIRYNNHDYNVQECRLYKPSLNQYNGQRKDAELIIHHINSSGSNLLVCIPIDNNNAASASSALFSQIIPFVPSTTGSTQTINVSNYTLNHFIPKAAYYYYRGTVPYQPCSGTYNIILFDPAHAINMATDHMNTLSSVITGLSPTIQSTNEAHYYYNEKGTTQNELLGDDIYIDCRPVEEVDGEGNEINIPGSGGVSQLSSSLQNSGAGQAARSMQAGLSSETIDILISFGGVIAGIGLMYGLMYLWRRVNNRISDVGDG
jgi:carbonic anhydrase